MLPNLLPLTIPKPRSLLGLALVLIASAGCGSSEAEATAPPMDAADTTATSMTSDEASTTDAGISASSTTEEASADGTVGVTFDGSLCTIDDPTPVTIGDRVFVFTNNSDLPVRMKVMVIADGKMYEDLLAIQTENGGPGNSWSGPAWLPEALISFTATDLELADNQSVARYDLESGPHAVLAFATASPFAIWLCGPLAVTEG